MVGLKFLAKLQCHVMEIDIFKVHSGSIMHVWQLAVHVLCVIQYYYIFTMYSTIQGHDAMHYNILQYEIFNCIHWGCPGGGLWNQREKVFPSWFQISWHQSGVIFTVWINTWSWTFFAFQLHSEAQVIMAHIFCWAMKRVVFIESMPTIY